MLEKIFSCCLIVASIVCFLEPARAKNPWEEVDNFLSSAAPGDAESRVLMDKALGWLNKINRTCCPWCQPSKEVIGLLDDLERLELIVTDRCCSPESQKHRQFLVDQTRLAENQKFFTLRRVILDLAREMALVCQQKYEKWYLERERQFGYNSSLELMHMFLLEVIAKTLKGDDPQRINLQSTDLSDHLELAENGPLRAKLYEKFIVRDSTMATREIAAIAYETLEILFRFNNQVFNRRNGPVFEGDRLKDLNPEEAQRIFRAQIVYPCYQFQKLVGPGLFELAASDTEFLTSDDVSQMHGEGVANYFLAWAQFIQCQRLNNMTEDREELLELIGQIRQQEKVKIKSSVKASSLTRNAVESGQSS